MNKTIWAIVIVIIIIIIGVLFYTSNNDDANENPDTTSGLRAEDNMVLVTDQKPGTSVTVSQVLLVSPGFVVIHEDTNGTSGAVLGASSSLAAGESSQVVVNLSRTTVDGEKLHAMLHTDIDANGTFNPNIDTPVQSKLGGPLEGWFMISSEASESPAVTI